MRLLPRDERFFDLFTAVAERSVEASGLLEELLRAEVNQRIAYRRFDQAAGARVRPD